MTAKVCRRCEAQKPSSCFRLDARYVDGLSSWCVDCHRARNSQWAKDNRARLTEKAKHYREAHREQSRASNRRFKRSNAEKVRADARDWALSNKGRRRASAAAHKASKLMATPAWADLAAIRRIYQLAAKAEEITGVRMHVDHVIPLQHSLVCGLHVPHNLQILPGAFNEAKRNHWPLPPYLDLFAKPAHQLSILDGDAA